MASHGFFVFFLLNILYIRHCICRTLSGVFSASDGIKHLTRFCFRGAAAVEYQVNSTTSAKVYLFSDEQWEALSSITHCLEKLKVATYSVDFTANNGKYNLHPPLTKPSYYHVALADARECGSTNGSVHKLVYTLSLLNPDSQGHPGNHFSYDNSGLLTFYELVLLFYVIGACVYGNRLWQTICKGGPMHLAIKILTIAMIFHAIGALCVLLNLFWYSRSGEGKSVLIILASVLDGICQYQVLVMMISMSVGWTLSSATIFDAKEERLVNNIITGVSLLQVVFNYWELTSFVVVTRLLICGAIAYNVKKTVSKERSALRRDFYGKFIIDCYIWWLSYPLMVMISVVFAEYTRKKLIIFGVTAGQGVSALLMYKLFLSRSLYWEVSTLSATTLPLRMDRGFTMRKYTG